VLRGRQEIRDFYTAAAEVRDLFDMHGVTQTVLETTDPEVVVVESEHHGHSHVTNAPYRSLALGIIRVHDGQIVHYRDFMNPLTLAELTGRLVTATGTGDGR
jgi:ketosteroid isomerase-like protein